MTLQEIYKQYSNDTVKHGTDKGTKHSYLDTYELELKRFINQHANVLELGASYGYSLRLWKDFLINAEIYGIDLIQQPKTIINIDHIHYYQMDCTNKQLLDSVFNNLTFDIIIDDASHKFIDIVNSFNALYHKVKSGGLYIIEDVSSLEIISYFKELLDNIEVIDLRQIKGRWDDILIIIRK